MSGPGDPPEGVPDGVPGGGEDEYRSVVFDESFVKAARIQEFSARERLDGAARAVRIRHVLPRGLARQAAVLILLIMVAFGFAIYMGLRHPYRGGQLAEGEPLRATVVPLVPAGTVPAVPASAPFAGSPAEHYRTGAKGITNPPDVHREGGFAQSEVSQALDIVREYLTDTALNPRAVADGDVGAVRDLLDPAQVDQFDASLTKPAVDGQHEATGWLVRFDPAAQVSVAAGGIRVQGTLDPAQTADDRLEIASDHTFVYALRGPGDSELSLFTVRRVLRFRFSHQEIQQHHLELVQADVAAGPLACASAVQSAFRPILAGGRAPGGAAGVDLYDHRRPIGAVCAPMASGAPDSGAADSGAADPVATDPASQAPGEQGAGAPGAGGRVVPSTAGSAPSAQSTRSTRSAEPAQPDQPGQSDRSAASADAATPGRAQALTSPRLPAPAPGPGLTSPARPL